jgi:hypothetical protein
MLTPKVTESKRLSAHRLQVRQVRSVLSGALPGTPAEIVGQEERS